MEKDKKIKELTKMVKMYETGQLNEAKGAQVQEFLAISKDGELDPEQLKKQAEMQKMSRAEYLMS